MKVLGFRGDPKAPRYAVVSEAGGVYTLENAASDNKLSVPASITEDADAERLNWLYQEILAIFDAHPGIEKVMIKQNEYTQSDTKPKRSRPMPMQPLFWLVPIATFRLSSRSTPPCRRRARIPSSTRKVASARPRSTGTPRWLTL